MTVSPHRKPFSAIIFQGCMLPEDILYRIYRLDSELPGIDARNYLKNEDNDLIDTILESWHRLCAIWKNLRLRFTETAEHCLLAKIYPHWHLPLLSELGYSYLPATITPGEVEQADFSRSYEP